MPVQPCQQHLASSFQRYAYGVILAAAVGIPLGLLMGWFRLLDDIVTPVFDGLRFIAPIAWVPFAALWFGTGVGGPVMIIFAGAFPPCLINAYRGARFVEPRLIEAARMLGTGHLRMIVEILLPAATSPRSSRACSVSAGLGWQSLVGRGADRRRRRRGFHDGAGPGQRRRPPTVMSGHDRHRHRRHGDRHRRCVRAKAGCAVGAVSKAEVQAMGSIRFDRASTRSSDPLRSGVKVLDDINLEIAEQEFVAIVGPSGCGKTTCLQDGGGLRGADLPERSASAAGR